MNSQYLTKRWCKGCNEFKNSTGLRCPDCRQNMRQSARKPREDVKRI